MYHIASAPTPEQNSLTETHQAASKEILGLSASANQRDTIYQIVSGMVDQRMAQHSQEGNRPSLVLIEEKTKQRSRKRRQANKDDQLAVESSEYAFDMRQGSQEKANVPR